jgi:hypothetical protein
MAALLAQAAADARLAGQNQTIFKILWPTQNILKEA